ncbi:MAG: hypothetical protein ABI905_10915 [Betaproteobacteria bacterium]
MHNRNTLFSFALSAAATLMLLAPLGAQAAVPNHSIEKLPVAPGSFQVACSNIAIDSTRLAQLGGNVDDFWTGANDHYVRDILLEPGDTLVARPQIPNSDLYPGRRNTGVDFVVIACYPTDPSNPRPDYLLPDGQRIPHMQRVGQLPILAPQACTIFNMQAGCGRWPLMMFSHGLAGSPVDGKSVDFLVRMASYGYIVAAPFHGDKRFSRVKVEDLGDIAYILLNFDKIVELQALRPLSMKAVVDLMLASPQFAPYIDETRIGGIGGSMGGATMIWLLGAEITSGYPSLNSRATVQDPRIKAAVGYVPYAGQRFLPAFGDNNATANKVTKPFLAISGTADTTAPIIMMEQAMKQFRGARYQVALTGVEHTYATSYADDVFGWVIPFFSAYLNGDKTALDQFTRQKNIKGGLDDNLHIDYTPPTAVGPGEVLVDEFRSEVFNRYFITSRNSDKNIIDSGIAGPGWSRTGYQFKGFTIPGPAESRVATQAPVCRFFYPKILTHFFSTEAADCNLVRTLGTVDEGVDFWAHRANTAECPTGSQAVLRLYNNRWLQNDSNHRYTTSRYEAGVLVSDRGWINEGVVMCTPL